MANRTVAVVLKAEIGSYVASLNKAAATTMKLGEAAKGSQAKASKSFDIAGKAGLVMGGAVVAGLGLAISKAADFEKSMSGIAAATHASAGTLSELRAAAMQAGADTAYSATEAADAITEMSKAGVSAKDIMAGGLKGALSLAAAGQLDVADAAGIASTAMTQFNLTGQDLPHVADLLAAGAGKAMGSVEDLGMALGQAGLVASAAGMNIDETTGTLSAFASAGLIGADSGTSLKSMLLALEGPSSKATKTMESLGINIYDANGKMLGMAGIADQLQTHLGGLTDEQRNSALATIFGSDAVRAANVLYKEGGAGITDWTNKVDDAGYATETAAAMQDNLRGDLEKLGGSFDTLMISLGSGAQGPLREVTQMFTGILNVAGELAGALGHIPGPVVAGVTAFAALALLRGPLDTMFTKLAAGLTSAVTGMGMATGATTTFGIATAGARLAVMSLITAAAPLAGLVAAAYAVQQIVAFAHAGDDATASVKAMGQAIKDADGTGAKFDATSSAIDDLKTKIADLEPTVESWAKGNRSWFEQAFIPVTAGAQDARDSLQIYQDKLTELQAAQDQQAATVDTVGKKFGLTSEAVLDLADKYGIDLSQGIDSVVGKFSSSGAAAEVARAGVASVGDAAALTDDQIKAAQDALDKWLEDMQKVGSSFVDPLALYTSQLSDKSKAEQTAAENTAIATKDSSDSWQDYVANVGVSLDDYAAKLEEQLNAQDHWRANIITITQRGGIEVGQAIEAMGADGIQLAAQMADGTDAEFQRMAGLLVRDARNGGADAAAAFDSQMKIMAEVGAEGASATALAVAQKLGIGLGEVSRVAAQYGITLADGINPVLSSLGKTRIVPGTSTVAGYGKFAEGGYTGHGSKYEPAGVVHRGEYVLTKEQTSRLGVDQIEAFANQGYASGGFVTAADVPRPSSTAPYQPPISTAADGTMQRGYDAATAWMNANGGGVAGGGSIAGGTWTSIWGIVKQAIPSARINSTYRPGDPGYHGRNKAIDFGFGSGPGGAGSAGLASIARFLYSGYGRSLAEIIYDGIGDNTPDVKNGRDHVYNAATRAEHHNHVHAAVYHGGTDYVPQTGYAYLEKGEAVIPAALNSREFSGGVGGRASSGSVQVAAPQVTVNFHVDGQEFRGMTRTEIDSKLGELSDQLLYANGG